MQLCQRGTKLLCFHAPLSVAGINGVETVTKGSLTIGSIDRADTIKGIAVPLVDADVKLYRMMWPAAEVPDERSLRQIHEEVQVVAELLEEPLLQIFLQSAT